MGGQGKTTVAKQVFNDKKATGPYRAWVTVSQSYTVEGILRDMLLAFYKEQNESPPSNISTMDRVSLKTEARNYLQEKRYVVFFDDVWNTHFWDDVEHALIDNKLGSRVFITTRDGDVINFCKKSSFIKVHELQPLTEKKSLELFCKKAFFDLNGNCPPNLVKISTEIVSRCNGLPLAIVAMGGVLAAKKRDVFVWEDFSKYLSSELEKDPNLNGIGKILGISYDDLPAPLKPCLLYFGMYPEDYAVEPERMTRQWIAEGLVKEKNGKSMEKVAKEYLTELRSRNLVQVVHDLFLGEIFRVHDLLHDMILKKSEDLSFCQFISKDDRSTSCVKSRRISTTMGSNDFMLSTEGSYIRSLLFFIEEQFPDELSRIIPIKYKLLKVLDFQDVGYYFEAPDNFGLLIHLRYLNFSSTKLKNLPESIGKLENLETLNLTFTDVKVLPKEIGKLRKLRHLLFDSGVEFAALEDIGGMTSLQTLSDVSLNVDGALELIIELEKLRQLRVLRLSEVGEQHKRALCSLLKKLQHLEELFIEGVGDSDLIMDLHFTAMPMLQVLRLDGVECNSPMWFSGCQNLVKLTIWLCSLADGAFQSLQNLPNLLYLNITFQSGTLHVYDGGFPNLKHMIFSCIDELEFFYIERGALPSLEYLALNMTYTFEELPSFQHLKSLKCLDVFDSFKFEDSQQLQIIEHVPLVQLYDEDRNLTHRFEFGKEVDLDYLITNME